MIINVHFEQEKLDRKHLATHCFFQQGLNQCVLYFPNKGSSFKPEWDLAKKRGTQIQPTKLCQKSVEATPKKIEKENPTWWLIPLSKWVITPVISGLTLLIPFITGVITHLLSGMSHQVRKQC